MITPPQQEFVRVCVFEIAQEHVGVRIEFIAEVVPMATLSRPPSMSPLLEGFLNLGGAAIPVLKTATLLGLPPEQPHLHTPLVILRRASAPLALLVSRVMGIVSVPVSGIVSIDPGDSFNGCVEGRLVINGDAVHLLSVERLLLEKEWQTLAEFQAAETRRLRQFEPVAS